MNFRVAKKIAGNVETMTVEETRVMKLNFGCLGRKKLEYIYFKQNICFYNITIMSDRWQQKKDNLKSCL